MRIRLKALEFDPLTKAAQEAPAQWDRWVVQFERSPTRADIARMQREYGLTLAHYIPELAYLERIDANRVSDLRRDRLVRWVGPYVPEYKLDPAVRRHRDAEPSQAMTLLVAGHQDVSSESLVEAIRRAGYTQAESVGAPPAATPRARVVLPASSDLTALTRLPEVLHIEPWPRTVIDRND